MSFALLLMLGVAVLSVCLVRSAPPADGAGVSQSETGQTEAQPEGVELESARTATSDSYALPSGERETRVYQAPINYEAPDGEWRPIEEGFEREGGAFVNGASDFEARLPGHLGSGPMRVDFGEAWIAERLMGPASEAGQLEGESATYEAAGPGTEFELATTPSGIEEKIVLENPSQSGTLHFELTMSAGVEPTLTKEGSVIFRGGDGVPVAALPHPVMYDSGAPMPAISDAVAYGLQRRADGTWELTLEADRGWLGEAGRQWPVTIDPVLSGEVKNPLDCDIWGAPQYEETSFFCGSAGWEYDEAFALPETNEKGRALLQFPLEGAIPATAYVESAAVHLYSLETVGSLKGIEGPGAVTLRNVVNVGNGGWSGWVNWRRKDCNATECPQWYNRGGDFGFSDWEITNAKHGTTAGWWDFGEEGSYSQKVMTATIQSWLQHPSEDYGFLLKQREDAIGACEAATPEACKRRVALFASNGNKEVAKRPYISVTYLPKAPATSQVAFPTEGTRTARNLKLKAKWGPEGSVSGVTFEYRTEKEKPGTFEPIPPALVHRANGEAVKSWPIPSTWFESSGFATEDLYLDATRVTEKLKKEGGPIYVRATFAGSGGVEGYSEPVEAVVDRTTGDSHDAVAGVGPGTLDLETGNLSISRTDVSIPGFASALEFSRTYNTRAPKPTTETEKKEPPSVLGPGWKTGVPVEEAGGSEWRNVRMVVETGNFPEKVGELCEEEAGKEVCEPEIVETPYRFAYAVATDNEGGELEFEESPSGTFIPPPTLTGWSLVKNAEGNFVLSDPAGDVTTFKTVGGGNEYLPFSVNQPGGGSTRLLWNFKSPEKQLEKLIAPSAPGLSCVEVTATAPTGCHALKFNYAPVGTAGERLTSIEYLAPGNAAATTVAHYEYNPEGRLIAEYDPRASPKLEEKYAYGAGEQLKELTPPGQKPWKLEYGTVEEETGPGRLIAVKRASLLTSPTEATTTIAYGVPLTKPGGPYEMGGKEVAQWGQKDLPVEATAIFPPSEVPTSNPPSSWGQASVYYMDSEGYAVNTATPKGGGTSEPSISTAEPDPYGNIVRELGPKNRLAVLAEPAGREARWIALQTTRRYTEEGTQMVEELGPIHPVRIVENGEPAEARLKTVVEYDQGWPGGLTGGLKPHLPTRETSAASNPEWGVEKDKKVTETHYNWNLRRPTETIIDPGTGHLNIKSFVKYEEGTGLPVESRQPKAAISSEPTKNPGTTKILYYGPSAAAPCTSTVYSGLPCETLPAGQTSGTGRPELLVKRIVSYNSLEEPLEVVESPAGGAANVRRTIAEYDAAGRRMISKVTTEGSGSGKQVPKTQTLYSPTLGLPEKQQLVCEKECTGFDSQATRTKYDELGRPMEYEDADGNVTKTTYDLDGRPSTVTDAKGTQTYHYNETSGLLTSLEDSGAGTFTATYDADGNLVERGLPNGLTAKTTYNAVDEPIGLAYTKTSSCGESCTWYTEALERSVYGQILTDGNTLVKDSYKYDNAGRLKEAQETPAVGGCTSREYAYDADSNRESRTVRPPGVGGICASTGGAKQEYKYDEADRLLGTGLTYDAWGRITKLPAEYAGGKLLETEYFANNMVASQTQNGGVTNTYELDATGRQRQRIQAGGVAGTEIFHYDGSGDSLAWTSLGSTWTRSIGGIGGELAAVQENSGTVTFDLSDLHGDVVETASANPTATEPLAKFRFDEFGEPEPGGSAGRFGWLGGHARRTELSSGVIQMGARSYIPQLGRFLTPDPVPGGSANAYDYADQDPVNGFDLTGTKKTHSGGGPPNRSKPPPLLKSHTVKAIAEGGSVHAVFGFTAGTSVTVRAHVSFHGSTGPVHEVTSKGTTLPVATSYPGTASTGEIATVCVHAFTSSRSETHCYNTPVTANEPEPKPEPEPEAPLLPVPVPQVVEDIVGIGEAI